MLMHGLVRIGAGPSHFAEKLVKEFGATALPGGLVRVFGLALPFGEALVGLLVLLGLWLRWSLVAGALLIMVLLFGTSLRAQWDVVSQQMIYAVVYFLLLAFLEEWDHYSVDGWRAGRIRRSP